jgi:hypothetical protein
MLPMVEPVVEKSAVDLLATFNEHLRLHGTPDFGLLDQCPVEDRPELLSLMNVALLAYKALEPERRAFRRSAKQVEAVV